MYKIRLRVVADTAAIEHQCSSLDMCGFYFWHADVNRAPQHVEASLGDPFGGFSQHVIGFLGTKAGQYQCGLFGLERAGQYVENI